MSLLTIIVMTQHGNKFNRKVQGVPQSQATANPSRKEKEKKRQKINACKINKQMHEFTNKNRDLKPEDYWCSIAHLSAEDMLKSAVIEKKKFKHSPWVGADNPLGPKF